MRRGIGMVLVLGAMLVGAGGAHATEFTASAYPIQVSAQQAEGAKHKIQIGSGTTECETVTFSATLSAESTELTVKPFYAGCKAFGLTSTVTGNGCAFVFHTEAGSGMSGTTDIECPAGKSFTIDTPANLCNTHYGSQTGIEGVSYENSGNHILLTMNLTTIHAVVTGTIFCPVTTTTTTYTNAKYTGTMTLKGDGGATKLDL